jgi:branched-chain amino acid transport system ATP-binding protein
MVLVEQNLGMIRQLGQRGYAIDKGRVTATLDRDELRDRDLLARHLAI